MNSYWLHPADVTHELEERVRGLERTQQRRVDSQQRQRLGSHCHHHNLAAQVVAYRDLFPVLVLGLIHTVIGLRPEDKLSCLAARHQVAAFRASIRHAASSSCCSCSATWRHSHQWLLTIATATNTRETLANRQPLRIAFVTVAYPPEVNGVSMTVARVVQGMRSRQHQVQLVRLRQHAADSAVRPAEFEEVRMRGLPIPRYPDLKMGLPQTAALFDFGSANRPDLVHIATEGPLGWSALRAARRLGVPISSDFRTNLQAYAHHDGISLLKRPVLAYLRSFHSRTSCTMVPTESLHRELAEQGFRDQCVVARGVDRESSHPSRRSTDLHRQWGASEDHMAVMCVGRLAPGKNLIDLSSACQVTRRIQPRMRLVLVGDGPARQALQAACPEAILAASRTGDDLSVHQASADAFVFASLTETFGNVTPEAMVSGLPVLAYDCAAAAHGRCCAADSSVSGLRDGDRAGRGAFQCGSAWR